MTLGPQLRRLGAAAAALRRRIAHDPAGLRAALARDAIDYDLLRRLIINDKASLDALDEALRRPPGAHHGGRPAPSGNSIESALRRLRADPRPIARKLRAKVLSGEMSAHRVAIAAGYRKRT